MAMKARFVLLPAAAAAALVLLASCTANGGSIYATIESAKKTITSSLAKTLTIQDLASRGLGGPYDVAAGAIFEGIVSATPSTPNDVIQWNTDASNNLLPIAPPVAGQICSSLVFDGTDLWGAFFNPNTQTFGLYKSTGAPPSFVGQLPINDPLIAGKQIMLIQIANGNIFVVAGAVTGSPYVFELDYWDGATWRQLVSGLSYMINGVAFDSAGPNKYWAVGGTSVYRFSQGVPITLDGTYPTSTLGGYNLATTATQLNGVFVDGVTGRIFIPSKSAGVFYSSNSGGTWAQYGPDHINSNTVGYLCVAGPADTAGGDEYLAGADGYGYYYMNVAAGTFSRFNDSTILLYNAAVRRILIDLTVPGRNSVFMGTAGGGLWRASFNSGSPDPTLYGWIHE
jgi:hypothetical protein